MKLSELRIKNFKSIKDSGSIRIESLQAFVGENNAGKSNILSALDLFLTSGAGGLTEEDFFNPGEPISITATFGNLLPHERKPPLRKYLLGDKLILEKQIALVPDKKTPGKLKAEAEYHGYIAKPKDWWLSVEGVLEEKGDTFRGWKQLAEEHGLSDYVTDAKGNVNRTSYSAGMQRYSEEHPEIEYVEPKLGETQALGLQPALLEALPAFHLLPAITDYSEEIDKRATNTNFRKLMADLSERILKADPRYQELIASLTRLTRLLNAPKQGEARAAGEERLAVLSGIESKIRNLLAKLMPSTRSIRLDILVDEMKEVFSRGVSVRIDDGKDTDVLRKGHGMQRCVVFAFLQALVLNQRGQLVPQQDAKDDEQTQNAQKTIIFAIEEPELYIHPQMQRAIYSVLKEFALSDQVIYVTHEPAFVDIAAYHQVAVVRKPSPTVGTQVTQCEVGMLGDVEERKGFQFLNTFGVEQNEMFFAQKVILVEGEEDLIGILATGRHLGLFTEFPEERGYTVIVTGNKEEMLKFMKVLSAFKIPYVVLHELDGNPSLAINVTIKNIATGNRRVELPNRMEEAAGHKGHFGKTYDAKMFFKNPQNSQQPFKDAVTQLFADVQA
ncbi:MAG: AAA family ATPase [Verrucomicrobiota bacterium]